MEDRITQEEGFQPEVISFNYAGFWIRFVAHLIDIILLTITTSLVNVAIFGVENLADPDSSNVSGFLNLVIFIFYYSLMHSSSVQATLGKMAVGIKVVDTDGGQISLPKGIGRYFSKLVSALILLIGFIIAGFDSKKQALHDKITGTYVIYET
jgi:uncharacterized RDD family membrane protein YckC